MIGVEMVKAVDHLPIGGVRKLEAVHADESLNLDMGQREHLSGAELIDRAEKIAVEARLLRRQVVESIDQFHVLRSNSPADRKRPRKTRRT
jgi:hypothetical protein